MPEEFMREGDPGNDDTEESTDEKDTDEDEEEGEAGGVGVVCNLLGKGSAAN